jgi:hypothetical protein
MELDLLYLVTVVPAILLFGISKAGLGGSGCISFNSIDDNSDAIW